MSWLTSLLSPLSLAELRSRPDTSERGDNGVSWASTRQQAEKRLRELDHNYDWRGANKWKICDRMRKSDPKIAGLRRAQTLPLLRVQAQITESEDAAKVEFVRKALLEDFPWRAFLQTVSTYVDYGFAAFAVNWRVDDDRKYRISELRHMPCSSIATDDIYVERGAISRIVQRPDSGGTFDIPGEYLLWFCHDKEGDDYTGRPILRAMHKPWFTKERLEVLLPILIEKMGGIPVFSEVNPLSDAERAKIDAMGESFVLGERQYIRKPADVDFSLVSGAVNVADILEAIRYFDTQLTNVCQAQYLDLGVNQAGSRAYGTTLADMFSDSVQAQASYIEDVLNARGGLIHQLVAYNFPNDDDLPKLRFASVQHTDIKALAESLLKLGQAGMPFDDLTWEFIRGTIDLPYGRGAQVVVPAQTKTPPAALPIAPAPQTDTTPDAQETPDESGTRAAECGCGHEHEHALTLAEYREPVGPEVYLDLAELAQAFDEAKTAVRDATAATRGKLVDELARRAMTAATKGTLDAFAASKPPMVDALSAEIRAVFEAAYATGRGQVRDELDRQRRGTPAAVVGERDAADAPVNAQLVMAEKPLAAQTSMDELQLLAEQAARRMATETLLAAAAAATRTRTVPLTPEALREAIQREADAAAMRVSATVTDLLRDGRADEGRDQWQDIEQAWYSAILDNALCPVCAAMDGRETTDLDEAAAWTPNARCEGGARCRCVTIYEYKTGAEQEDEPDAQPWEMPKFTSIDDAKTAFAALGADVKFIDGKLTGSDRDLQAMQAAYQFLQEALPLGLANDTYPIKLGFLSSKNEPLAAWGAGRIWISTFDEFWDSEEKVLGMNSRQWMVADSRVDILWHELGHHLHAQTDSKYVFDHWTRPAKPSWLNKPEFFVSHYGAKNTFEFVAEVFAALHKGIPLSPQIIERYRKLGGFVP